MFISQNKKPQKHIKWCFGKSTLKYGETQSKEVEEAQKNQAISNPDEIDIDDDDESEEEEETSKSSFSGIEQQAIPSEVFGGLRKDDDWLPQKSIYHFKYNHHIL